MKMIRILVFVLVCVSVCRGAEQVDSDDLLARVKKNKPAPKPPGRGPPIRFPGGVGPPGRPGVRPPSGLLGPDPNILPPSQLLGLPSGYGLKQISKYKMGEQHFRIKYHETFYDYTVLDQIIVLEIKRSVWQQYAYGRLVVNLEQDFGGRRPEVRMQWMQALDLVLAQKGHSKSDIKYDQEMVDRKVIWMDDQYRGHFVYWLSYVHFDGGQNGKAKLVGAIVDMAQYNVIQSWDGDFFNMKGNGGNVKTGKHRYGEWRWAGRVLDMQLTGLPPFTCRYQNAYVKLFRQSCPWVGGTPLQTTPCSPPSGPGATTDSYSQANDVHYLSKEFLMMLKKWYGDTTISTHCPNRLRACVNMGPVDNAFYYNCRTWYYDGNTLFHPLGSTDVVAHEISHGFTQFTSGLIYNCQSGAINEAFSDIAGKVFEFYLKGTNNWMLGYDVWKNEAKGEALRYMCDPPRDSIIGWSPGKSLDCQNQFKFPICPDVHLGSGIYNKAFCLLATKPGWDTRKAFDVFYLANLLFWSHYESYNRGACGALQAASTLGYNLESVEDAFAAVGVFCRCPPGFIRRNAWSCYKIVLDVASWAEAKVYCKHMKAHLVSIESSSENDWLEARLQNDNKHHLVEKHADYWIGGTDLRVEGNWRWDKTRQAFGFTDWAAAAGEPNNFQGVQNCAATKQHIKTSGQFAWYDDDCYQKKFFICEKSCM